MESLVMERGSASRPAKGGEHRKVLVTGADGYIGSVLCPLLDDAGFDVTGLDTGFYRAGWLFHDDQNRPRIVTRDIRNLQPSDFVGYDAVVHLAELSNDPLCEFDEDLTIAINHGGSLRIAEAAKAAGVPRFIYASSCSIYGAGGDDVKTEKSEPNPQTAYARCKAMVERDVSAMADETFCPTFLRFATAFGASPRMRFDIVLNNLAGLAWTTGRITMSSDGTPWRPLAHIRDISAAIIATLNADTSVVKKEIFNVGDNRNNYRVREITDAVAEFFPNCAIDFGDNRGDNRSYRVSFDKIHETLPDFRCRWTAQSGARELHGIFKSIAMTAETFNLAPFTRLHQLRHLIKTSQVNDQLYWQPHDLS